MGRRARRCRRGGIGSLAWLGRQGLFYTRQIRQTGATGPDYLQPTGEPSFPADGSLLGGTGRTAGGSRLCWVAPVVAPLHPGVVESGPELPGQR